MLRLLSCLILHTHRISIFLELLDYPVYENICCSGICVTYLIFSSHIINAVSKDTQTHWLQRGGLKKNSRSNENLCFGFWLWLVFFLKKKHANKSTDIKFWTRERSKGIFQCNNKNPSPTFGIKLQGHNSPDWIISLLLGSHDLSFPSYNTMIILPFCKGERTLAYWEHFRGHSAGREE